VPVDSSDNHPQDAQAATSLDKAGEQGRSGDTVQLSPQAQELNRIRVELAQLPEVDEARVEAVREQIANGSYRIDAEQIAAQILVNERDF
jgi:negative regulator of flagellin synthesis FlgM